MARVKRAVAQQEAPPRHARAGQGLLRQQEPLVPSRQRAGHALAAVRLPRPPGPQGRVPPAVDPADQRRLPPERHQLQPVHRRPEAGRVEVDRKVLADLAVTDPAAFAALVEGRQPRRCPPRPERHRGRLAIATTLRASRPATTAAALARWRRSRSVRSEGAFVVEGPVLVARGARRRRGARGGVRRRRRGRPADVDAALGDRAVAAVRRCRELPSGARPAHRRRHPAGRGGVAAGRGRLDAAGRRRRRSCSCWSASPIPATPARSCARPRRPGAGGVVFCAGVGRPVQPQGASGPSAGALFHVPVVVDGDAGRRRSASSGPPGYRRVGTRSATAALRRGRPHRPGRARARQRGPRPRPPVLAAVDERVTIPMAGRGESLNVAMAATVLCFEALASADCREHGRRRSAPRARSVRGTESDAALGRTAVLRRTMIDEIAAHRGRGDRARSPAAATLDELPSARQRAARQDVGRSTAFKQRPRRRCDADERRDGRRRRSTRPATAVRGGARRPSRASSSRRRAASAARRPSGSTSPRSRPAATRGHLHLVTQAMERLEDVFVGHGLHRRRGSRGRDRLVQLRGAQHPAGTTRPATCRTRSTSTLGEPGDDRAAHPHVAGADPGDGDAAAADLLGHAGPGVPQRHPRRHPLPVFHQIEGLVVDRGITLRPTWPAPSRRSPRRSSARTSRRGCGPSYFPFTEPSAEFDITASRAGCDWRSAGSSSAAAAWSTPTCSRNCGIDPEEWSGLRLRLRHRPHGR